jgi:hypothetical protein
MSLNTILATAPLTTTNYVLKATGTALGNSLIWDNGTNVGIGNTNTSYTLDVSGTGRFTGALYLGGSTGFPTVGLLNRTSDTTLYMVAAASGFTLTDSSLNTIYNATPTSHTFNISNAAKMTINSSGNVGIGTTSPTAKLQITNTSAGAARVAAFLLNESLLENTEVRLAFAANTNNDIADGRYSYISALNTSGSNGQALSFATNETGTSATERMQIKAAGNVLISAGNSTYPSSSSSSYGLQIFDKTSMAINVGGSLIFQGYKTSNTNVGNLAGIVGKKENGTAGDESGFLGFLTSNSSGTFSEKMRITSGGNVLIGGTSDIASGALVVGDNSSTRPLVLRGSGGVDGTYITGIAFYPWNTVEQNLIKNTISGVAGSSGFQFMISNGFGSSGVTASMYINRTSVTVVGSLAKGSGSFRIDHPLESMTKTHQLVHSFIEGPQADLIYRGKLTLINGKAQANIDEVSAMTEGTFEALCREVQCFTTNESGWDLVKGKVIGNIIYIESQNPNSTDEISWMVIGERKDKHMMDTEWTDDNGRVIVEPLKRIESTIESTI